MNSYAETIEVPLVGSDPPSTMPSDQPFGAKQESAVRPKANLVVGSGADLTAETECLLRYRLRSTSILFCGGLSAFLIAQLTRIGSIASVMDWIVLIAHVSTVAMTAFFAWRLCRHCTIVERNARTTELIVFGGTGAFFSLVSLASLLDGVRVGYVPSIAPMWMTLIFTYALFIPNNWQRAAVVIGTMALVPILLMIGVQVTQSAVATPSITGALYLQNGSIENVLALLLSTAIAIWGVFMVNSLRLEVFEAKQFGQYQLRQRLGAGGMGEVYLAEHVMLKRKCAIKVIRPDRADNAAELARFEREVRAAAQLTHWNSIEIFDYGRASDGTFYYVMEYLPGMNLEEVVRKFGPMPEARIVHILKQVCEALREAHCKGLIHRDIKPANIFLTRRGGVYDVAKLLDFGLVSHTKMTPDATKLTHVGTLAGTPDFMSPEQALSDPPDARSDLYSLGVVAWYLATGRRLFDGDSPMKVMVSHIHDVPEPLVSLRPEISPEFNQIVMDCLEKSPSQRPESADALLQRLRSLPPSIFWSEKCAAKSWNQIASPQSELARA